MGSLTLYDTMDRTGVIEIMEAVNRDPALTYTQSYFPLHTRMRGIWKRRTVPESNISLPQCPSHASVL